jgi:hypothetical protein
VFAARQPQGIDSASRSARFEIRKPEEGSHRAPPIAHIWKDAAKIARPNHSGRRLPPLPLDRRSALSLQRNQPSRCIGSDRDCEKSIFGPPELNIWLFRRAGATRGDMRSL